MNTIQFKHSPFLKVAIVILVALAFRIFVSCTPPAPIKMEYNMAAVTGIDNSGRYMPQYQNTDTMHFDAVAFNLVLYDSAFHYHVLTHNSPNSFFAFSKANALSVAENFVPVNKVNQLKITTLFDIDNNTKAGSDVTDMMLCAANDFELYKELDYAISRLNGEQFEPKGTVQFVFPMPVLNTMAAFAIDILLDNGKEISCVSATFTITSP
jgi:hypothetical protein